MIVHIHLAVYISSVIMPQILMLFSEAERDEEIYAKR